MSYDSPLTMFLLLNAYRVYEDDIKPILTERYQNQFMSLMQDFHLVSSLSYKVKNLPRFAWNHNYTVVSIDGFPIAMKDFKSFPGRMLKESERRLQVALQGLSFPDFDKVIDACVNSEDVQNWIKDDLRNREPGYSFLTDPRNPFQSFSETLLRAIMDEDNNPELARRFFVRSLDGKVHLKRGETVFSRFFLIVLLTQPLGSMHDFFYQTGELLDAICVLVKATQGGDTRGSEMACHQIVNTQAAPRSLYGISGYLALVNFYSKTRQNTGNDKLLARFPATEVMRLLLYYLVLIRPVELSFAGLIYGEEAVDLYTVNLWVRRGKEMETRTFTKVLRHFTDLYLHVPLAVSDWRQLVTNIFRNILHINLDEEEEQDPPPDSLLHMFGRDEATTGRNFYGLEYSHLSQDFDEATFANWLRASIHLHEFLGLSIPPHAILKNSTKHSDTVDVKLNCLMKWMEDMSGNMVKEETIQKIIQKQLGACVKTNLLPSIQEVIAQAVAPYVAKPLDELKPVLPVVAVQPQRVQVLRELLGDATAKFKSAHQAELFELVCQRSRHVIGVLPTGGGKSITIFGPPKLETGMFRPHASLIT